MGAVPGGGLVRAGGGPGRPRSVGGLRHVRRYGAGLRGIACRVGRGRNAGDAEPPAHIRTLGLQRTPCHMGPRPCPRGRHFPRCAPHAPWPWAHCPRPRTHLWATPPPPPPPPDMRKRLRDSCCRALNSHPPFAVIGTTHCPTRWRCMQGCPKGKKKDLRNANRNECSRGRSLLPGHGAFSTSKAGGWQLVAVGSGWRLAVGGGWQRLAVGGWWRLAVGGWRLVAVGSGWRLAVGGDWRLAVGGWLSLGAVLKGCP